MILFATIDACVGENIAVFLNGKQCERWSGSMKAAAFETMLTLHNCTLTCF
jgi:hypothetical protein